jgi:hypothetical protein
MAEKEIQRQFSHPHNSSLIFNDTDMMVITVKTDSLSYGKYTSKISIIGQNLPQWTSLHQKMIDG